MDGIHEAWDIVFGEGVFEQLMTRLFIILGSLAAILLLVIVIAIWKAVAGQKVCFGFI